MPEKQAKINDILRPKRVPVSYTPDTHNRLIQLQIKLQAKELRKITLDEMLDRIFTIAESQLIK